MKRTITVTAGAICAGAALLAGALYWASGNCSAWSPLRCHGADPELTAYVR